MLDFGSGLQSAGSWPFFFFIFLSPFMLSMMDNDGGSGSTESPREDGSGSPSKPLSSMVGLMERLRNIAYPGLHGRGKDDQPSFKAMVSARNDAFRNIGKEMTKWGVPAEAARASEGRSTSMTRVRMASPFHFFKDWCFFVGRDSDELTGIAVRTKSQVEAANSNGWTHVPFTYYPPEAPVPPSGSSLSAEIDENKDSLMGFMSAFEEHFSSDEALDQEALFGLVQRYHDLPGALKPSGTVGHSMRDDDDAGVRVEVVPATINMGAINTCGELLSFVENPTTGMLQWASDSDDHLALRNERWKDNFKAENKKIRTLLGAYCYLRREKTGTEKTLDASGVGNKQELKAKASKLYGNETGPSTWYSRAEAIHEEMRIAEGAAAMPPMED